MKHRYLLIILIVALVAVTAGCSRPETPQQVATGFWQALAEGKVAEAVELSTLADAAALEGLDGERFNTLPDFGKVVIEADKATIETILATNQSAGEAADKVRREITTYLVRVNDQWLVDYQRTREALADRPSFSGLKEDLSHLRKQLDEAVGRSSEQIAEQVDQLAEDFERFSEESGKKAEQALESFGESLEEFRKRLEESLDKDRQNPDQPGDSSRDSLEQTAI